MNERKNQIVQKAIEALDERFRTVRHRLITDLADLIEMDTPASGQMEVDDDCLADAFDGLMELSEAVVETLEKEGVTRR